MVEHIQFGSRVIEFSIEYTNRKTIGITVTPDMTVIVKSPTNTDIAIIKDKVKKRAAWIIKQQNFFVQFHPKMPKRKYISGETHLYLGRQYQLKVVVSEKNQVSYKGRFIEVATKDSHKTKDLLLQWYKQKAKEKFAIIAEPIIEKFKEYNVEPRGVYIQDMATRWGSCTQSGRIILNPELIKAPKGCIEYVITHELCHLIHHNHTQKFLDLQNKLMPNWEKWKNKLERMLA